MKIVSSSIEIAAPAERVWHVLVDFASYPTWNPFIQSLSGPLKVGEKLSVRIKPPGKKAMAFKPTLLVAEQDRELRWIGRLLVPGVFDGEHHFQLTPTATGCSLLQEETFSGVLVPVMGRSTYEQTGRGFVEMNQALKRRAEA